MRRAAFIFLWTAIFAMVIFGIWMVTWGLLTGSGILAALHQDFLDRIEALAFLAYFAVPVLGLILGLFGKLPGTSRIGPLRDS